MPQLFYGNFDFEHQLADPAASTDAKLARINAELTPALVGLVTDPKDRIYCPPGIHPAELPTIPDEDGIIPQGIDVSEIKGPDWTLVPWGWSAAAFDFAQRQGLACDAPPLDVVNTANCRKFGHELERDWGCGLEGTAIVGSLDELAAHIALSKEISPRWVVKTRFGMSGRERILGSGPAIDEASLNWARRRLERDSALLFEPWMERIAETGLQFEIPPDGDPQLLGLTPLLSDQAGHYRGNHITVSDEEFAKWDAAVQTGERLAKYLQQLGYFGPLGIDAMRYRDRRGQERLRPLQDINARHTMGRVALGFRRLIRPHEPGSWLHRPAPAGMSVEQFWSELRDRLPKSCRVLQTSPNTIGGQPPRLLHAVVTGTTAAELAEAEQDWFAEPRA